MQISTICPGCMRSVQGQAYSELHDGNHWQQWHPECHTGERQEPAPSNLDKALSVVREDWRQGLEVFGYCAETDRNETWIIIGVDWTRAAGPVLCEREGWSSPRLAFFQPWELTKVPTSLEEVEAFLSA